MDLMVPLLKEFSMATENEEKEKVADALFTLIHPDGLFLSDTKFAGFWPDDDESSDEKSDKEESSDDELSEESCGLSIDSSDSRYVKIDFQNCSKDLKKHIRMHFLAEGKRKLLNRRKY
jgi:hypothetical protein